MSPVGPGKYDAHCTRVREETQADAVIVIVLGGTRGSGFACQADLMTTARLPELLERVTAEIRMSTVPNARHPKDA